MKTRRPVLGQIARAPRLTVAALLLLATVICCPSPSSPG